MEKTIEQTTVTVGSPINGISINGDELLLDNDNNIMEFTSKDEAYNFLRSNGIDLTDEEMEESFNFYVNGEL